MLNYDEKNIKALFEQHRIPFTENNVVLNFTCPSPSCGKENKAWVKKATGWAECYVCQTKWNWNKLSKILFGNSQYELSLNTELNTIVDPKSVLPVVPSIDSYFEGETEESPKPIKMNNEEFPSVHKSEEALEFLLSRGVDDAKTIQEFDLRYGIRKHSIAFPVYSKGTLVGYQERFIGKIPEGCPKTMTSIGFKKTQYLLNYDKAIHAEKVAIVEGPFDCIKANTEDVVAVASFGKKVSPRQLELLLGLKAEIIYVGLDKDAAIEAMELIEKLSIHKTVFRLLPVPHREDIGACTKKEVMDSYATAIKTNGKHEYLEVFFK